MNAFLETSKPSKTAESCSQFVAPLVVLALTNSATVTVLLYLPIELHSRTTTDYSRMPCDRTVYQETVQEISDEESAKQTTVNHALRPCREKKTFFLAEKRVRGGKSAPEAYGVSGVSDVKCQCSVSAYFRGKVPKPQ